MPGLLEGKAAIITGSSRGIGSEIAKEFAGQGAKLVLHGTNEVALQQMQRVIQEMHAECSYVVGDISDYRTSELLAKECMERYGRIDSLVNNAGINSRYSFLDLPIDEWERMIKINLNGAFYTCKCVIPMMLEQKSGTIINMSSSAGKTAHPNASISYGVSKAGINSLTQKLAFEFAARGIRVNAICPGPIETDMSTQWTEEYRDKVVSSIPLKRLGTGTDIANVAVFLASELSSFIIGESINVNGGKYMN